MITLYNTLTKKKETFEPLHPGKVGMYTCGPTVYGYVHIGNLRSYVTADMLRRLLGREGYEVRAIKNITDVGHLTADDVNQGDSGEDKVERVAKAEHKTPEEIATFYEAYFRETEKALDILPANYFPRATAHIPQMVRMIEALVASGHAYEANGNVFLDVTSFPEYGRLSGNTLDKLRVGARLEEHPDKRHPWDFALWLKAPAGHLMRWDSPWSTGYPGWHIECSAMSTEYLGDTLDIHTGGEDNIFPHHEAEIVQSEGVTGKPFARYWVHTRHMLIDGEKMSKSKGNFYRLEDVVERGFSPMHLRLLILSSHYRSQMNFTWEALHQARANYETLRNVRWRLSEVSGDGVTGSSITLDADAFRADFLAALEDDLNTPGALAVFLRLANETNRAIDSGASFDPTAVQALFDEFTSLLGLRFGRPDDVPDDILALAEERDAARAAKDYTRADDLRGQIEAQGYLLEDSSGKTRIKPRR